ncbi:polysaccharide deacetylase family protein [Acinetobacter indicus]|uniref:polysaccharide deacetylase family protein n=1 Tax=Acinetobacter indicus TaxID=756892 RepID=UPI000CECC5C2|nr:polysaccharide deacetylase family protein [Acinetobacter indicus]
MGKLLSENQLNWFQQIFFERFGVKFIFEKREDCIVFKYKESEKLIIFSNMDKEFYTFGETGLNCYEWNSEKEGMQGIISPILKAPSTKALPSTLINFNEKGAEINYDILGLTFWMLNRLEEIHRTDLDNHERFPAINSHAYKYDYLERPIVDEWLDILQQVIQRVWPNLKLKKHQFSIKVSHDVDVPSRFAFSTPFSVIKSMASLVLKNNNIKLALMAPIIYLGSKNKIHPLDPYNTFDWLMNISEKNNLKSAFYFICGRTDKSKDALYEPEHPIIKKMMLEIYKRGHEVGLHPSYNSYNNPEQINFEAQRLKKVCKELGIEQSQWGGRMHFLRWSHPTTLQAWNDAEMSYDSTLSYADRPGFRCGTCHEYTGFNPVTDTILNIKIRPLIIMDCSVIAKHYMGLGYTKKALNEIIKYKRICEKVEGNFTFLWHNSFFNGKKSFKLYEDIIQS